MSNEKKEREPIGYVVRKGYKKGEGLYDGFSGWGPRALASVYEKRPGGWDRTRDFDTNARVVKLVRKRRRDMTIDEIADVARRVWWNEYPPKVTGDPCDWSEAAEENKDGWRKIAKAVTTAVSLGDPRIHGTRDEWANSAARHQVDAIQARADVERLESSLKMTKHQLKIAREEKDEAWRKADSLAKDIIRVTNERNVAVTALDGERTTRHNLETYANLQSQRAKSLEVDLAAERIYMNGLSESLSLRVRQNQAGVR
jgi:hypothetical protein